MTTAAVILAGCGRMDGSEVHESTLALLFLARNGADYECFGIDAPQVRVVNHLTGETVEETRNQMVEGARIARGDIRPIAEANADQYDLLVIPGGGGGFENLGQGPGDVHPEVRRLLKAFADAGKPIAAICIAPVLVARALGERHVRVTIGNDADTIQAIESAGARHVNCTVDDCVVDPANKVVTTPAYMLGPGIADVAAGIEKCIGEALSLCLRSSVGGR